MRFWPVLFLFLVTSVSALEAVTTFVHDEAGILDEATEGQLTEMLTALKQDGIAEVAVVTVATTSGEPIEDIALRLAHGKLGDTQKDNGLLLLVAVEDRAYRIEVGYGLEGVLNDAKVGRIARTYLVPAFQLGEYGLGVLETLGAINAELRGTEAPEPSVQEIDATTSFFIQLFLFLVFFGIIFLSIRYGGKGGVFIGGGRGGSGGGSGGFSGGFGGGGFGGGGAGGKW